MSIKLADEIAKEIKERGQIQVPDGCVTGEEFEKWLREKNYKNKRRDDQETL